MQKAIPNQVHEVGQKAKEFIKGSILGGLIKSEKSIDWVGGINNLVISFCLAVLVLPLSFGLSHGVNSYKRLLFSKERWPLAGIVMSAITATIWVLLELKEYLSTTTLVVLLVVGMVIWTRSNKQIHSLNNLVKSTPSKRVD